MISVLIVDDHQLIREGLKKILQRQKDMRIAGEARDYFEMQECLRQQSVDCVILDITMPGKNGLEILKELKIRHPSIRTIILSMHPEERFAVRSIKAGASGYLNKEAAATEMIHAIRKVMTGGKYISQTLAEKLANEISHGAKTAPHETLSDREFEVARLIASGKSTSEIAQALSLSANTIATYRARILEKMGLETNAELIRYALEHHLVD